MDIEDFKGFKFELDMEECIGDMAKDCRDLCEQKAPSHTGEYKKGFIVKETINKRDEVVFLVGNTNYRLPHLLEYGHVVKNKYGTSGKGKKKRVSPRPHMRPAYEQVLRNVDSYTKKVNVKIKE